MRDTQPQTISEEPKKISITQITISSFTMSFLDLFFTALVMTVFLLYWITLFLSIILFLFILITLLPPIFVWFCSGLWSKDFVLSIVLWCLTSSCLKSIDSFSFKSLGSGLLGLLLMVFNVLHAIRVTTNAIRKDDERGALSSAYGAWIRGESNRAGLEQYMRNDEIELPDDILVAARRRLLEGDWD
jgi:hypothetical protein